MQRLKPFVLPFAIVVGLLFHRYCAMFNFLVPYLIFSILLLAFCAVDIKKLHIGWLDMWLMLFQIGVSVGCYVVLSCLHANVIIAEGVLLGILCPVASSVSVISCMLGANRETVTTYTIVGNLMVAIAAPAVFTAIGVHPEMTFVESFWLILRRIAPTLALPFFLALLLQHYWPKANQALVKYKGGGFYLWSFALIFTIGQTIDFIFLHGEGNGTAIIWLAVASLLTCIVQFAFGKWMGKQYGDTISGGQLLGQKNTAMGIWMATTFLHPLASVFMACYSIYQNLFNSWQIWRYEHK